MEFISAQERTRMNRSPPFHPFHSPRLTPVFHAESTAARKKYVKTLRLFARNANGIPASAPLRKKRFVGRTERGKSEFQRQILPHAEPTDAERTAVSVMIFFERLLIEVMGLAISFLNLSTESANVTVVTNRARRGTERRMLCKKAGLQLGLLEWSNAQDKPEIDG